MRQAFSGPIRIEPAVLLRTYCRAVNVHSEGGRPTFRVGPDTNLNRSVVEVVASVHVVDAATSLPLKPISGACAFDRAKIET